MPKVNAMKKTLLDQYQVAGWMTVVAFLGWLIIPRITISHQSALKRKQFRYFIDLFAGKIQKKQMRDLAFDLQHIETEIPKLESAVLEAIQFIRPQKLDAFNAAFESYKNVRFATPGTDDTNAKNEEQKAELIRLLSEMQRLSK